eukprot:3508973-Amphidinium_carterae.1
MATFRLLLKPSHDSARGAFSPEKKREKIALAKHTIQTLCTIGTLPREQKVLHIIVKKTA